MPKKKIEPFYQSHKRLDELTPEKDYREIVNICINRLIPKNRIVFDLLIYSTVLQSSVPPEDFPVLFRKGRGTFMTNTEKRMCDQNIIFSTFFDHENGDQYREAIVRMNYMHSKYPDYINQRSLFRAGIKFAGFLGVAEKTVFGENTKFRLLRKYSDKFEQSIHLLWSEIFTDMKIKGMSLSYEEMMDFIYDKNEGPIHHDFIPAGNKDVEAYYAAFEDNYLKQNFSGWKRWLAPLGKRFLILSLPHTTRLSVGKSAMKFEWLFIVLVKTLFHALSLRAVYLPSLNPVGSALKDHYIAEYQGCPEAPINYVGQGTKENSKAFKAFKQSPEAADAAMSWSGCPYNSDNDGKAGRYQSERPLTES